MKLNIEPFSAWLAENETKRLNVGDEVKVITITKADYEDGENEEYYMDLKDKVGVILGTDEDEYEGCANCDVLHNIEYEVEFKDGSQAWFSRDSLEKQTPKNISESAYSFKGAYDELLDCYDAMNEEKSIDTPTEYKYAKDVLILCKDITDTFDEDTLKKMLNKRR